MISSTFMGPYQQPGVAGCATSLEQYPVAGSYPLFRARATHHIHFSPEHQTEESSPEEERRRTISRHLWIQVQATVCPDILINFMPALWPSIHTNLPCTLYTTTNPEPIQNQMWNLPISWRLCRVPEETSGLDESRWEVWTSGWTWIWEHNSCNFRTMWRFKGFSEYQEWFVQFWFNDHLQF